MSGGHFNFIQSKLAFLDEQIIRVASTVDGDWNIDVHYNTKEAAKRRITIAALLVKAAAAAIQRVDYLACDDDGVESFVARWDEEVEPLLADIKRHLSTRGARARKV